MAARRLVVVMLVLLFVSSLAAALAPVRPDQETTTAEPATTTRPAAPHDRDAGRLVRGTLDAGRSQPGRVHAAVGDQLQLRVDGRRPATVEIPRLGATESVGPLAPARFDLLLSDAGAYSVRLLETGRQIGVIAVRREARPERPRARARGPRAGRAP